jgi:ubiquinone biosynthesis protein UbiJ
MLTSSALAFTNHLLAGEDWARDRLAGFAGKTASLQLGSQMSVWVRISETGLLERTVAESPPTVSIQLPADAPVRALSDRASLFASATIAGSAELAETLGFVFRNLRWDAEHDLSQLVGDVLARRGLQLAARLARWQVSGARNLALGVAEYLTEEAPAITRRRDVERFCSEVDALRDDLARCEKRLARAEAGDSRPVRPA